MTIDECMNTFRAVIDAVGRGPEGQAERSQLRKERKDLYTKFYPNDFRKPQISAPQSTKRSSDHDASQYVPAAKKKKATATSTGQTVSGSSNPDTSTYFLMKKKHGNTGQASASPSPELTDHLDTLSSIDKEWTALPSSSHTSARKSSVNSRSLSMHSPGMSDTHFNQQSRMSSSPTTSCAADEDHEGYEEGDEDDSDDWKETRTKRKVSSTKRSASTSTSKKATSHGASNKKNSSWTDEEFQALWRLLAARRALEASDESMDVLKDERLMAHMSEQLADEGIYRSKNACKNFWNRYGREWSKFEERVGNIINRSLTTSAQNKRR
jgi:hypothetical protein